MNKVLTIVRWGFPSSFQTWSEVNKFRITRNRPDWRIIE